MNDILKLQTTQSISPRKPANKTIGGGGGAGSSGSSSIISSSSSNFKSFFSIFCK